MTSFSRLFLAFYLQFSSPALSGVDPCVFGELSCFILVKAEAYPYIIACF